MGSCPSCSICKNHDQTIGKSEIFVPQHALNIEKIKKLKKNRTIKSLKIKNQKFKEIFKMLSAEKIIKMNYLSRSLMLTSLLRAETRKKILKAKGLLTSVENSKNDLNRTEGNYSLFSSVIRDHVKFNNCSNLNNDNSSNIFGAVGNFDNNNNNINNNGPLITSTNADFATNVNNTVVNNNLVTSGSKYNNLIVNTKNNCNVNHTVVSEEDKENSNVIELSSIKNFQCQDENKDKNKESKKVNINENNKINKEDNTKNNINLNYNNNIKLLSDEESYSPSHIRSKLSKINIENNINNCNNTNSNNNDNCNNININNNMNNNNSFTAKLNQIQCEESEKAYDPNEEVLIANILLHHYLFFQADDDILNYLINELNEFIVEKDTPIFEEGEEGSCLFIIKSGQVEISQKNVQKKLLLCEGDIFGELAMVKVGMKRSYSAHSITKLDFYMINSASFSYVSERLFSKINFKYDLFNYFPEEEQENLYLLCAEIEFAKNNKVSDLSYLFGVEEGSLILNDVTGYEIATYKKGDVFGTDFLFKNEGKLNGYNFNNSFNNSNNNINNFLIKKRRSITKSLTKQCHMTTVEYTRCTVVPIISFIEVFGIEYSNKILFYIFDTIIRKNIYFNNLLFNRNEKYNNIKDIFNLFQCKEYIYGAYLYRAIKQRQAKKLNEEDTIDNSDLKFENENAFNNIKIIIDCGIRNNNNNNDKNKTNLFKVNDIIGEELLSGKFINYDIIVYSNRIYCLESNWEKLKDNVKIHHNKLSNLIGHLRELYLFNLEDEYNLVDIAQNVKIKKYKKKEIIIPQNKVNDNIYFVKKGHCKLLLDKKKIRYYNINNSFGEIQLLNGKPTKSEIISCNDTETFVINKSYFLNNLMGRKNLNQFIKKKLCLEDIEIFPNNLFYLRTLWNGQYSNVYLVHNKLSLYALKSINVHQINKHKSSELIIKRILQEKDVSIILDDPFIVHYVKTLKNSNWCFFILEYIHGMTLEECIDMCNLFGKINLIKFYAACLFIILDKLKSFGIVHRDIKPRNILIDTMGYIKLIDFSTAKKINNNFTFTIIGTPYFIAPEILKGEGYNYTCDYWSVGICLYYLLYGTYPYGNNCNSPDTVYKEILNKNIAFPPTSAVKNNFINSSITNNLNNNININIYEDGTNKNYNSAVKYLKMLISKLLTKKTSQRISNFTDIVKDKFFKDFDWINCKLKKMNAPFIPQNIKLYENKLLNNCDESFNSFIFKEKIKENDIDDDGSKNKLDKDVIMSMMDDNAYKNFSHFDNSKNFSNAKNNQTNLSNWMDLF